MVITVMGGVSTVYPDTPIVRDLHQRWQAGENPIITRQNEDKEAVEGLGASLVQLGALDCVYRVFNDVALYPDETALWGEVNANDPALTVFADMNNLLKGHQVFAPLGVGNHVDHRIVRDETLRLWQQTQDFELFFYTDYPYMREASRIAEARAQVSFFLCDTWQPLDEGAMTAKIRAMSCYRSQVSTFWKDETAMQTDVRRVFVDENGEYAERFWAIC